MDANRLEEINAVLAERNEAVAAVQAARTVDEVFATVTSYPFGESEVPHVDVDTQYRGQFYGSAWGILRAAFPFTDVRVSWRAKRRSMPLGRPAYTVRQYRPKPDFEPELELWEFTSESGSYWASANGRIYRPRNPKGILYIQHYTGTVGEAAIPRGKSLEVDTTPTGYALRHGVQIEGGSSRIGIFALRDFVVSRNLAG